MGYFSFNGNLDTCITIRRSLLSSPQPSPGLRPPSPAPAGEGQRATGGGWVNDSEPEAEFQETVNKSKAVFLQPSPGLRPPSPTPVGEGQWRWRRRLRKLCSCNQTGDLSHAFLFVVDQSFQFFQPRFQLRVLGSQFGVFLFNFLVQSLNRRQRDAVGINARDGRVAAA